MLQLEGNVTLYGVPFFLCAVYPNDRIVQFYLQSKVIVFLPVKSLRTSNHQVISTDSLSVALTSSLVVWLREIR